MIIQCGRCSRKYKIDDERIKPDGSNVRCSQCGHIFLVKRAEPAIGHDPLTEEPDKGAPNIDIEKIPVDSAIDDGLSESALDEGADIGGDDIELPVEERREDERGIPDEDMLDMELDHTLKDAGNWEEFVSISKTTEHSEDIEANEGSVNDEEQNEFNWENINIEEEPEDNIALQHKSGSQGYEVERRAAEALTLDTDSADKYLDTEGDFGHPEKSTIRRSSEIYRTKPKGGAIGKIAYTLMIAAVFVIIVTASITILVNLELIPEKNVTKAKTFVESILPVKLTAEQTRDIVITQHSGKWINTRYGPLYVVSGMIENISDRPIHYIQIRSEFVSAGKTLYEDTIYAGNTFNENELKVSKIEDIIFKLKKKNGDIDYYDMKKLSGLNYDVQPGESIPFFAVFPNDRTVLGLKYNLHVVNYEDSLTN